MRFLAFLALLMPLTAAAQDAAAPTPAVLQVEFNETEAIPGQPLELRLTVLAPTFMPAPPVWPSFEAPNLLVRLPGRSTHPTSARIEGETWAGITRNYQISPMVPGSFTIPPQQVIVTYADPDSNAPLKAALQTDALAFRGVIPPGAEDLTPFIAANALELAQTIEGQPEGMKPGDSVTRTIVATVDGTAPIFLPDLLSPVVIAGVAAYPDEPLISMTDDSGSFGGTRTESVVLLAESGGSGEVPAVEVDWFNLQSGKVETASAEGFTFTVDAPPATNAALSRDWRRILLAGAVALVALGTGIWLLRRMGRPVRRLLAARRETTLASERHAYRQLRSAVASRDNSALRPRLDDWAIRCSGPDPRDDPRLQVALTALGAGRYGPAVSPDPATAWEKLQSALSEIQAEHRSNLARSSSLPDLNPT